MACVKYRPRKNSRRPWIADYRDATGRRRTPGFRTKREAEDELAAAVPASRERHYPVVSADVTVAEYAERWLALCSGLKPRSREAYREKLDIHILPSFGTLRVRRVHRGAVRKLLSEKLGAGLAPATVQLIHATLRAMLAAAVEDDVIRANPATGLGRSLKLQTSTTDRSEHVKAFDRDQLEAFLTAAERKTPELHPLLYVMSRTGLRLGEALGLQWDDLDLEKHELRLERSISTGADVTTPKSGHGRTVDLSQVVVEFLRNLRTRALEAGLRRGTPEGAPWLFPAPETDEEGRRPPLKHQRVESAFKRVLRAARLPGHYSPHCLRHTYASILLAAGVSPAYVQQQLGHARIELTVGTYGRWLRKKAPGALDHLEADEKGGDALVTGSVDARQQPTGRPTGSPGVVEPLPAVVNAGRGSDVRLDPDRPVAEKAEMVAAVGDAHPDITDTPPQTPDPTRGYAKPPEVQSERSDKPKRMGRSAKRRPQITPRDLKCTDDWEGS